MRKLSCALDLPYPEVQSNLPNLRDVRCILNDYAGKESELTAIMQYMYQAMMSEPINKEISDILEEIAVVEMMHFEMLGNSIVKMKGDPIIGNARSFWNGSYVNYAKNIKEMLLIDIKDEEIAIANYKRAIECATDHNLKELLARIIMDEELHIKILKELLEKVCNA